MESDAPQSMFCGAVQRPHEGPYLRSRFLRAFSPRLSGKCEPGFVLAISLILLTPCFWQQRIQAGDLASHLYNAWLAGQIHLGAVRGLSVVPTWTNVLSDWLLEQLISFV